MRYKLTISYDGTCYAGWQVQKNGQAIQPLVQKALQTVLRKAQIDLSGSGRTDAGVHAKGQTAHFDSVESFDAKRLLLSLNALLPLDIRVLSLEEVSSDFHARYSAKSKIYHYHLHLDPVLSPFTKLYSHQVLGPCDLSSLKEGASAFLGTHDFSAFANATDKINRDGVRTLYRLDVVLQKGGCRLEFEGNGFLYKMVRNITGALLEIGAGKMVPGKIPLILASKDRKKAPAAAPAKGLFLMQVVYTEK